MAGHDAAWPTSSHPGAEVPATVAWCALILADGGTLSTLAQVGSTTKLISATLLPGATSTLLTLRLECWGRPLELVLRLFINTEWLAEKPDLTAHESTVLRHVVPLTLPTPR